MKKRHQFGQSDYRLVASESVFQGFFKMSRMVVEHRLFQGGWSKPVSRELFQRGDAVGVLLYDPVNQLVGVVEQFRVGAMGDKHGPWQYEIIAGMLKPCESQQDVAVRELQEESGIAVEKLLPICDYLVSGGGSGERMYMFCGLVDLSDSGGVFGLDEENEDILFQVWPYNDAIEALNDGLLNSAAMTIAMLWLQLKRDDLRLES